MSERSGYLLPPYFTLAPVVEQPASAELPSTVANGEYLERHRMWSGCITAGSPNHGLRIAKSLNSVTPKLKVKPVKRAVLKVRGKP